MKDRIPVNPGRVLITPEDGSTAFYATMTRADNPTQEGDKLNKATLLKDATAALYNLDPTAVPDDVFAVIRTIIDDVAATIPGIHVGSYVGAGINGGSSTTNKDNTVVLNFETAPSVGVFIIGGDSDLAVAFLPVGSTGYSLDDGSTSRLTTTWENSNLKVSFYYGTTYPERGMYKNGSTYLYFAV